MPVNVRALRGITPQIPITALDAVAFLDADEVPKQTPPEGPKASQILLNGLCQRREAAFRLYLPAWRDLPSTVQH
jgi:hypothetical protein